MLPAQPPSPRLSRWQRLIAVGAPPLVVGLFVLTMGASLRQRAASTRWVEHTTMVLRGIARLRLRLVDAETGQRGYVITGDTAYLDPYHHARDEIAALEAALRRETRDNPAQQARLDTLGPLVERRFRILEGPLAARREQGIEPAARILSSGAGRAVMDSLRGVLSRMEGEELRLLHRRDLAQARGDRRLIWVLLAGAALVLGVAVLVQRLFSRHAAEQIALNDDLREANSVLQDQAAELEAQADELRATSAQLEETMIDLESSHEEMGGQRATLEALSQELTQVNRELQQTNTALEERSLEAESANRAKTEFLTSMSHELRTPLNAIAGYVDLMELGLHGPLTEAQRASLERVRWNGRHLLTLINDILHFARIQAGKLEVDDEPVELGPLLDEITAVAEPLGHAHGLTSRVEPSPPGLRARGDRDRIAQILLNLLSNAAKWTDPGGTLRVWAEDGRGQVRIHVTDSGRGIPPHQHERIFDPFVQLAPENGIAQGVGLGLSISRELARAMHGELEVRSVPGSGSTFTLVLPAAEAEPSLQARPVDLPPDSEGEG